LEEGVERKYWHHQSLLGQIEMEYFLMIQMLSCHNNEIYIIDLDQEIQLRALIYEKQKTYMEKVADDTTQVETRYKSQKGNVNVTKILDTEQSLQSNDNIRWAFKIVVEGISLVIKNIQGIQPFYLLKTSKLSKYQRKHIN